MVLYLLFSLCSWRERSSQYKSLDQATINMQYQKLCPINNQPGAERILDTRHVYSQLGLLLYRRPEKLTRPVPIRPHRHTKNPTTKNHPHTTTPLRLASPQLTSLSQRSLRRLKERPQVQTEGTPLSNSDIENNTMGVVAFDKCETRPAHIEAILGGLDRYNPETTTVFQDYVSHQCEERTFDCYANLALLKL